MTSSIARMNCFLHGIEDFRIERGDTLAEPKLVEGDRLQRFDVVLANPPYSIKQWNREAFAADPWGRNLFGVPPQGRADYAFQQHILQSLRENSGRSIALWPHGLLSREEEAEIRKKLVATDQVEAIVGLGRKLFYNSGMESCLFVCRKQKSKSRKGKILFINAEDLVTRERAQSFLSTTDIETILAAYRSDKPVPGISTFATLQEVLSNNGNLNIKLYLTSSGAASELGVVPRGNQLGLSSWITSSTALRSALEDVIPGVSSSQLDVMEAIHSSKAPLFDRSSWKRVRLGDVATEYAERVDNPSESGFDRYIGSDCIDKHDFRVRRWDPAESVKSSMKAFRVGDYLLVRRSLYGSDFRERAPRANFDGICSADILTIRENPEHIADGFLIAILYSKGLWEFVVQHAKGSLTRRIKWRELASFEFDLLPLDQQRRIAEILWAADEAEQEQLNLKGSVTDVASARLSEVFADDRGTAPFKRVEEIAALEKNAIVDGPFGSNLKSIHYRTSGVPVIQSQFVTSGVFRAENYVYVTPEHFQSEVRSKTVPGDIIMAKIGENCGTCAILPDGHPTSIIAGNVLKITTNTEICLNRFLLYYFKHEYSLNRLIKVKNTTAQPAISLQQLKRLKFRLPPIEEQRRLLDDVEALESAGMAVAASSKALSTVRTELINSIT